MKIGVLCGISRLSGGIATAVRSLSQQLSQLGCSITVFNPEDSFTCLDQPAWGDLPIVTYKNFGPMKTSFAAERMLLRHNLDIVHCHGLWEDSQRLALKWQKITGKPVVISPHGMLDPWALNRSAWKKKIVRTLFADRSLHHASCLHALCESEARSIRSLGLKNSIAIIPNGIDPPVVDTNLQSRLSRTAKKKLLFLGRIHPKKGLVYLLEGWGLLKKERERIFENWQLIIAGWDDGGFLHELKQIADRHRIDWIDSSENISKGNFDFPDTPNLVFTGPVFDKMKEKLFEYSDVFILPSLSEGLPVAVLEAWSYSLPVVMTEQCNISESFYRQAAIKIDISASDIMQKIAAIAELSEKQLSGIGGNGRKLLEEKFLWQKNSYQMNMVYNWLLHNTIRPDCVHL